MGTPGLELDRLLENARWVRALGVELVGAGEADDLTQEAWVVALERPAGVHNPAAWLSGVVRRLAGRERRGAERRARRERAAARPEAQPGADELVAEAELQRELIRVVTELDEPFRSTVLLRFYRGLAPEEIAREQGVPAATVRTRLHRALARLRERLDRAHGGREAWAALFVAPGASLTGSTLTGGALMGAKTMLGGAAVLVGLVGLGLWRGERREEDSARDVQGVAAADAAQGPELPEPAAAASGPASGAREARASAPAAPGVSEVLLYGSVSDPAGAPVALDWFSLGDAEGVVRSASTASPGSYALSGLAPGRYALNARAKGFVSQAGELVLRVDEEHQRRDLVLEPALTIPVRLLDETGGLIQLARSDPARDFELVVTRTEPDGPLYGLYPSRELGEFVPPGEDDVGRTMGRTGLLRFRAPLPLFVSVTLMDATIATQRVDGPMEELVFTLEQAAIDSQRGGLRARFVNALSGEPVLDGRAALERPSISYPGGGPLGEGAVAEWDGCAPGLHTLRFYHPDYTESHHRVRVHPGRIEDLGDVAVWPKATIRGVILDAHGQPANASIRSAPLAELRGPADLGLGYFLHVPAGRFELEGAPRGPVRLFVMAEDHALLVQDVDASAGMLDGLVLQLHQGTPVLFRPASEVMDRQLTLADDSGRPFATWRLGTWTIPTRLVPGVYQLWLGTAEVVETREELRVGEEPVEREIGAPR